ncbi:MAG: metallophosphoesterase [Bryobacteraceae bacterium]
MQTIEEQSLAERLKPRIAREKQFETTGRKLRNKSLLFRHEKIWIRPLLKFGLQMTGLYNRGLQNALQPVVRRLEMWSERLPSSFDGYKILHVSDLHIDGRPLLTEKIQELLANVDADVCLITGDYRFEDHGPCDAIYPEIRKLLPYLTRRDGVFSILGNHDISEIAFALSDIGLRMLINDSVEIRRGNESIWIVGIDDPFDYKCDDLPGSLANVPAQEFKVLLSHTPELYQQASELGIDLYLCGHTHAGQIRLPVVGALRNNASCPKEYAYGPWRHGSMQAYTSAGVGCSALPIRYNCPPEVTVIELRNGSNSSARNR